MLEPAKGSEPKLLQAIGDRVDALRPQTEDRVRVVRLHEGVEVLGSRP